MDFATSNHNHVDLTPSLVPALPLNNRSYFAVFNTMASSDNDTPNITLTVDSSGKIIARSRLIDHQLLPPSRPFGLPLEANFLQECQANNDDSSLVSLIQTAEAVRAVISGQIPQFETIFPVQISDGTLWFRNRAILMESDDQLTCMVSHEEVTSTIQANEDQRLQRRDEHYFRLIAEGSDKASFLLDEVGKIQWVNPAFVRLFHFPLAQIKGREIAAVLKLMECGTHYLDRFRTALMERTDFKGEVYAYDGHRQGMWLSLELRLVSSEDFSSPRLVGYCTDVTESRNKEEQLRKALDQAEEMASKLQDHKRILDFAVSGADLAFWEWAPKTGQMTFNERWAAGLGYSLDDLPQHFSTFQNLLHPLDKQRIETKISQCLNDNGDFGDQQLDVEFRLRSRSGEYLWMHSRGRVVQRSHNGQPSLMCGVQYCIQDRKNTELRIEGLVRLIDESSNELYIFGANDLKFVSVNRGARENLGYTLDELNELTLQDTMPEMSAQRFNSLVRQLNTNPEQRIQFETTHRRKDGTGYPIHVFLQKTKLVERHVYAAFVLDLSKRKLLERQLAQARKLQSIGQLAAGIAHEINTPIHFVNENLEYMQSLLNGPLQDHIDLFPNTAESSPGDGDHPSASKKAQLRRDFLMALNESAGGIDRVIKIICAMKLLSHPGNMKKTLTDLNQLVHDTVTITQKRWKKNCIVDLALTENLASVMALPSEVSQVMINLLINAVDAIDEHAQTNSVSGRIGIRTWAEEDCTVFEFEDNGPGIPRELVDRVFDPFFTTKEVGKGTGQGLAICHSIIVEQHQGTITLETQPEQGTRFTVRLPNLHDSSPTRKEQGA